MEAAEDLATSVGTLQACLGLSISRATLYRRRARGSGPEVSADRGPAARALSEDERRLILDVLHSERFCDCAPAEVYATLLDEGIYLASASTMYRVLSGEGEVRERRSVRNRKGHPRPELSATRPNHVWSWDITRLRGPVKWSFYYLYVIIDIFSRYVVGWMVAQRESAQLAERLIADTYVKQGIEAGKLTVHSDRGPAMRSHTVALLLSDLGITKTHSRPYTASDNPYSEAHFKTLKYRPEFPDRFSSPDDARLFLQAFFGWYNTEHRHSGIGYMTPEVVHYGRAEEISRARQEILLDAYNAHPERFVGKIPEPPALPEEVWINKPEGEDGEEVLP
jgi:putative transposase